MSPSRLGTPRGQLVVISNIRELCSDFVASLEVRPIPRLVTTGAVRSSEGQRHTRTNKAKASSANLVINAAPVGDDNVLNGII
jgi:hypothetical protein